MVLVKKIDDFEDFTLQQRFLFLSVAALFLMPQQQVQDFSPVLCSGFDDLQRVLCANQSGRVLLIVQACKILIKNVFELFPGIHTDQVRKDGQGNIPVVRIVVGEKPLKIVPILVEQVRPLLAGFIKNIIALKINHDVLMRGGQ